MGEFASSRIAQACAEALFPPHTRLGEANVSAMLSQLDRWLGGRFATRAGYSALLHAVDWQCRFRHGQPVTRLGTERRQTWFEQMDQSHWRHRLLEALALPLKAAYLSEPGICAAAGQRDLPKAGVPEPARWKKQIMRPADIAEGGIIEADVAIIGSGAGGAIAAYELASHGLAVVILEEGPYVDRNDFLNDPLTQIYRLYRTHGATGSFGNALIPIPLGKAVGGTTLINSGTCLRTPARVLAEWQADGLCGFDEGDLDPYFQEVETVLQVQPAEPRYLGAIADVIAAGAEQIGLHDTHPLNRNAAGCDGQGLCQFGCPTGAKQSTNVSVIPRALDRGAVLLPETHAEKLLHRDRRVTGIRARDLRDGTQFTVKVREVVVAAGSLLSPTLLRRAGVRNRWLGRNLSIHPAGAATGWFPGRDFGNSRVIPQGFGVDDLHGEGLIFEGATPPLAAFGLMTPGVGQAFQDDVARYRETAFFGFMIRDESRGHVLGQVRSLPVIRYRMNDADFALFRRGLDTLARIYLAAGAEEVRLAGGRHLPRIRSVKELETFWRKPWRPRDFLISAFHPLGTARIGAGAERGVCDTDHRVFGWRGLSVMDGAAVPSALGANPQVTIMSLALRAARRLAENWAEASLQT